MRPELGNTEPWMSRGSCLGEDSEVFYPSVGRSDASKAAKKVCARCPVRVRCLDFAMRHNEEFGVWGGLTARQRRSLRREKLKKERQAA